MVTRDFSLRELQNNILAKSTEIVVKAAVKQAEDAAQ